MLAMVKHSSIKTSSAKVCLTDCQTSDAIHLCYFSTTVYIYQAVIHGCHIHQFSKFPDFQTDGFLRNHNRTYFDNDSLPSEPEMFLPPFQWFYINGVMISTFPEFSLTLKNIFSLTISWPVATLLFNEAEYDMKNYADQEGCYPPQPPALEDNSFQGLQNSSYHLKAEFNNIVLLFSHNIPTAVK